MTYEQLLEKVSINALIKPDALRAIVELHKPVKGHSNMETYDYVGCNACVEWSIDGDINLEYPCPTIQIIEKELNNG